MKPGVFAVIFILLCYLLTHTVQMKLPTIILKKEVYRYFLTHTVQMKRFMKARTIVERLTS